jgi:hypothetical protein
VGSVFLLRFLAVFFMAFATGGFLMDRYCCDGTLFQGVTCKYVPGCDCLKMAELRTRGVTSHKNRSSILRP